MSDPELRRVFEAIHSDVDVPNWMICAYATVRLRVQFAIAMHNVMTVEVCHMG